MASGGVRVENLNKVTRALAGLGLDVDDLKDAFATIATEATEAVLTFTPRGKTGKLAASVRGNRAKSKAVVRAGRAAVPYAGPVNYGWPARSIQPALFMQKGDEVMQPVAVKRLEEEIEKRIRIRGL